MNASPRHILMTADAVGGVWTYALDLASELACAGVRTTLAVLGPAPSSDQLDAARLIRDLDVVHCDVPLDWTAERPENLRASAEQIADLAARRDVEIVHLDSPALAAFVDFPKPVIAVQHSCLASWWAAVRGGPLPADFRWRTEAVARGLSRAARVVAPTAAFARTTADIYRLSASPAVVHNGRKCPKPTSRTTGSDFVFTAGRLWDDGKNVATLERAASAIRLPIRAAGSLSGPNGATAAFSNLHCLGRLPERAVLDLLAARPIFASSSIYEPFGLSVLEAAAAGCALVLSDIPTFRELWSGAAAFVPAYDASGFAEALDSLAGDPQRRDAAGALAQRRARRYGPERMARAMLDVYGGAACARPALEAAI